MRQEEKKKEDKRNCQLLIEGDGKRWVRWRGWKDVCHKGR
jgi:hypothetical protein